MLLSGPESCTQIMARGCFDGFQNIRNPYRLRRKLRWAYGRPAVRLIDQISTDIYLGDGLRDLSGRHAASFRYQDEPYRSRWDVTVGASAAPTTIADWKEWPVKPTLTFQTDGTG